MSAAVSFPVEVVYEDAGEGWTMATLPGISGAFSQGRKQAEARENVRDALRELLIAVADGPGPANFLTFTVA